MSYKILPVTPTDLPDIAAICDAAFKDDPIVGHLMSNVLPEVKQAYDMHYWENQLVMSEYNGMILRKLVDEDGKTLAFAKWQYPYTLSPEQAEKKAQLKRMIELQHPLPSEANKELHRVFFGALEEKKAKWMDETKDFLLQILGVSPAHQRRGIGATLIREGLADADRHNARTYIEASPAGYGLYLRHGWKQVDEIVIDIGKYGGYGVATEKLLVREPGGN